MSNINISKIENFTLNATNLCKILDSKKLSDRQKFEFINNNKTSIDKILNEELDKCDFYCIMARRPLLRFRPFLNSFTKRGDKKLLAKALGIPEEKVNSYIDLLIKRGFPVTYSTDNIYKTMSYVYRHGRKDQVKVFFEYELVNSKNLLNTLKNSLEHNGHGVSEYFARPIHRMSGQTFTDLFSIVQSNLENALKDKKITKEEYDTFLHWSLVKMYEIRNKSRLIQKN